MEENKCFVLYKVSSVMIWTRANINPQSCLHAVNTPWVHWASTEDPERDLVPRVAKTSCLVGCSPYLVFFPNSPASGWCEGVMPQFPQSFYPGFQGKSPVHPECPAVAGPYGWTWFCQVLTQIQCSQSQLLCFPGWQCGSSASSSGHIRSYLPCTFLAGQDFGYFFFQMHYSAVTLSNCFKLNVQDPICRFNSYPEV